MQCWINVPATGGIGDKFKMSNIPVLDILAHFIHFSAF